MLNEGEFACMLAKWFWSTVMSLSLTSEDPEASSVSCKTQCRLLARNSARKPLTLPVNIAHHLVISGTLQFLCVVNVIQQITMV